MINFSGQTRKKRTVNLGDKKSSNQANYLEYTKLQREKREKAKQEERSSIVIQSYIRRYLEITAIRRRVRNQWENSAVSSDLNQSVREFNFFYPLFIKQDDFMSGSQLGLLNFQLSHQDISLVSQNNLSKLLVHLIASFSSKQWSTFSERLLETMQLIYVRSTTHSLSYKGLIPALVKVSSDLDRIPPSFLTMIAELGEVELQDYLVFLSLENLFDLIPQTFTFNESILPRIASVSLDNLSNRSKLSLVANCITLFAQKLTGPIIPGLVKLVCAINCTIVSESSDSFESELSNDSMEDSTDNNVVIVSDKLKSQIEILYSRDFTRKFFEVFDNDISLDKDLIPQFYSFLITLSPQSKSSLFIYITIIPNAYKWFYNMISNDTIFRNMIGLSANRDYIKLTKTDLNEFFVDHDRFLCTLFVFEELYSYWLVISNDLESFTDDKLTMETVVEFTKFLRCLNLTFILNADLIDKFFESLDHKLSYDYKHLREASITLLNLIYLKNLRLKFLPSNFWKTSEITSDINTLLPLVADEEEKRVQRMNMDSDSDHEISVFSYTKKKMRTISVTGAENKLILLRKLPFFIPFKNRVQVFQSYLELDRQRLQIDNGSLSFFGGSSFFSKLHANIHRDHLLDDAYAAYNKSGSGFKGPLSVAFFNEYGPEAGIDGGGITKEFLTSVSVDGFNPIAHQLFKETQYNQLYPNPEISLALLKNVDVESQKRKLLYIKFLGKLVGKCLYESVLIDIQFAPFFLQKWSTSNIKNSINDLNYLDKDLLKNMVQLLSMSGEELGSLDLNFTLDERVGQKLYSFNLVTNGNNIPVNSSNRLNYIHELSNFMLNKSVNIQSKFFLEGLHEIIEPYWLNMFDPFELQMLISGVHKDVDINDWKCNVEYGGYLANDLTVRYFWEVVEEMSVEQRCKLLKFVTSVSRAPLLGFGSLTPHFGIRNSGRERNRLPTSSTCVNLLKLPDYEDKQLIREKLLYAITTDSGFDLS